MREYECHDWDENGFPGEFVYGDYEYLDEDHMDELWKPTNYSSEYWVSTHGRVCGPGRHGRGKILDLVPQNGYLKVTLSHDGKKIDKRVNRLVAEAFVDNPYNLPIVMHDDNDPTNNHISNLIWGTHSENNQHCWDCNRHPQTLTDEAREKAMQKRRTPVCAINIHTGERTVFDSQHDAARALGVMSQHIWGVLNGQRRTTGGYRFEYLDSRGGACDE